MEAVSKELQSLIIQLQSLSSLADFALAGGTNLALRFNHRKSVDIDFFYHSIAGIAGLKFIKSELQQKYNDTLLFCELINEDLGDQYCFLRAFINNGQEVVKLEILQNMKILDPVEKFHQINMISQRDIGLFKLMSAANRKANKDIYDLDYITDEIDLESLVVALGIKKEKYSQSSDKCLFDLDHEINPMEDPAVLLEFDQIDYSALPTRPSHSNDRILIVPPSKDWAIARSSWRRKVRNYLKSRGIDLPPAKPVN